MKLFAVELRRILDVLCLRVLQQKFWAQFHDLRVQKRSCLPWNSDAFWKFSACKFYRKSCGRNSTIFSSKNEVVCREIQKVLCLRVLRKGCGRNSTIFVLKNEVVCCEIQAHFGVLALRGL